jgi:hypothetical protein
MKRALFGLAMLYACTLERAHALPTMIRLGYVNCAVCHVAPQGGGVLNAYGRGVDEAQSLRAGEYVPTTNAVIRALSWEDRITQDLRFVGQEQLSTSTGAPLLGLFRGRFMYRNATEFGKGIRFSATIIGENESAPRPNLAYEPGVKPTQVYVTSALMSWRVRSNLEFSAGRDQLPTGVNIPDLSIYVRSCNRMGYYDAPTQLKMFWWGKRYHVNPYIFGPAGNERSGFHESGGGALAEFDVLGHGRTVAGMNVLHGTSTRLDRTLIGPYTRLGFGRWGVFVEHDITMRTLNQVSTPASFRQDATYLQPFLAVREWLVASLTGERLSVQKPYRESMTAQGFQLTARLSPQFTLSASTRIQHNRINGKTSPAFTLQLAMKTPN